MEGIIRVERWPAELPLLVLVILASLGIWAALILSIFGIVYALLIAAFFFVGHLTFVAHVRGSAVRIGPEQFPELHARVQELSRRAGLPEAPAAYVMQAGGALNALATKLFRARMIVLFSDLLDACGDDTAARDMIVGHELGHIRAGHLSWHWLVMPGMCVPFLGAAYSRARERTCDRYGAALCGDHRGAVAGLAILAAGGARGRQLNTSAFARQREELDTGWMTLARWLSTYPPLCDRVAAVEPALDLPPLAHRGPLRALGILALLATVPLALSVVVAWKLLPAFTQAMEQAAQQMEAQSGSEAPMPEAVAAQLRPVVQSDLEALAGVARQAHTAHGTLPGDAEALYRIWTELRPDDPPPMDPFDGKQYGYAVDGRDYLLWSSGPDRESGTGDDIDLPQQL